MPSSRGIFLTQGLNLGLLHCGRIPSNLSHQGSRNLSLGVLKKKKNKKPKTLLTLPAFLGSNVIDSAHL